MATAEQLKALIQSHFCNDDDRFKSITLQIAAHTAKKGNTRLAEELQHLMNEAKRPQSVVGHRRAVPLARATGELAGLVTASYPTTRLSDMVLSDRIQLQIGEIVHQHRQRDLLRSHGLTPKRKLLLVGPPGCGKTMTATAIAGECHLPLMFVQLHALLTKYMGESAAKLHLVFDAMVQTRGVYLFDEFDAIGATRAATNDIGEMRRILNSFLQFMERDDSDSIIVAATNFVGMLDNALFRRFDDVVRYELPDAKMVRTLIENRLGMFDLSGIKWKAICMVALNLSHAEVARACDDAARKAVLSEVNLITHELLRQSIVARGQMRPECQE